MDQKSVWVGDIELKSHLNQSTAETWSSNRMTWKLH